MKFDVWKDTMSQSSYIKFQSYPDKGDVGGRVQNLNSWEMLRVERIGMKLGRKKSAQILDTRLT